MSCDRCEVNRELRYDAEQKTRDMQLERDAATDAGVAAIEDLRRLVRAITQGNICRLCDLIYGHHAPSCPILVIDQPPATSGESTGG